MRLVSFDFDNTLTRRPLSHIYSNASMKASQKLRINYDAVRMIRKEQSERNARVIIVTTRFENERAEIDQVIDRAGLKIDTVHFTGGSFKAPLLKELGVDRHYEDNAQEIAQCIEHGIEVYHVPNPFAYPSPLTGPEGTPTIYS